MPLNDPSRNYVQQVVTQSRDLLPGDAFQMLYGNGPGIVLTIPGGMFGPGVQISLTNWSDESPVFAAGAGASLVSSASFGPAVQFGVASIIRVPVELQFLPDTEIWFAFGNV